MPSLQLGAMWHPGPCIILRKAFRFSVVVASILLFLSHLLDSDSVVGKIAASVGFSFTTKNAKHTKGPFFFILRTSCSAISFENTEPASPGSSRSPQLGHSSMECWNLG